MTHVAEIEKESRTSAPIHPRVRIGHFTSKWRTWSGRSAFIVMCSVSSSPSAMGSRAAFLSAGGYHHHIGFNTWESQGGSTPPLSSTGLYHLAILYPTRAELADALRRLLRAGIPLEGASDHGVSEALYLRDPDGNGAELYCDRPREAWPLNADGTLNMFTRSLDLEELLADHTI